MSAAASSCPRVRIAEHVATHFFCPAPSLRWSSRRNEKEYGSVGHALLESVLLLAIADKMETSIMHLVGVSKAAGTIYGSSPTTKHRSFYTVGLTDEMSEALSSAAFGRQHTPNVKIKLDGNIDRSREILDQLDKVHAPGAAGA